jgi:hypothetical protein
MGPQTAPANAAAAEGDAAAARLAAMDPFPDLSEDEIVRLLEAYEKGGMGLGPVPEDLRVRGFGWPHAAHAVHAAHAAHVAHAACCMARRMPRKLDCLFDDPPTRPRNRRRW